MSMTANCHAHTRRCGHAEGFFAGLYGGPPGASAPTFIFATFPGRL